MNRLALLITVLSFVSFAFAINCRNPDGALPSYLPANTTLEMAGVSNEYQASFTGSIQILDACTLRFVNYQTDNWPTNASIYGIFGSKGAYRIVDTVYLPAANVTTNSSNYTLTQLDPLGRNTLGVAFNEMTGFLLFDITNPTTLAGVPLAQGSIPNAPSSLFNNGGSSTSTSSASVSTGIPDSGAYSAESHMTLWTLFGTLLAGLALF